MTLRLALVIDGDATGAAKALQETGAGVEQLGAKAEAAGARARTGGRGFEWLSDQENRARLGLKETGEAAGDAGRNLAEIEDAGRDAARGVTEAGEAANVAAGKFQAIAPIVAGIAGGLVATAAIAAVGEGLKAVVTAAGEYAREVLTSGPLIERSLKGHADLIGKIKDAYAEASGAASSYGRNAAAVLRFETQQNVGRLEEASEAAQRDLTRGGGVESLRPGDVLGDPFGGFGPLAGEVEDFRRELKTADADVIAFRERIASIAEALPADSPFRGMAEQMLDDTDAAAELQAELERARDLLAGLKGDADAAATALGGSADKYRDIGTSAGEAAGTVDRSAGAIRGSGEAATAALPGLREYDRLLKSIAAGGEPDFGSPARQSLAPLLEGRGFAAGGWTGDGPSDRVAGFVHGREYVFDAASTAAIGVDNLDAIRRGVRGYAGGGYVGAPAPVAAGSGRGGIAGLVDAAELLRGSFSEIARAALSGADALDIVKGAALRAADRLFDIALAYVENQLFGAPGGGGLGGIGGVLGSIFGGTSYFPPAPAAIGVGLYHRGGTVGPSPAASSTVPAQVFVGAPRLHQGGWLAPGERPVIAMDGEEIGWPEDLARKYGGSRQTVVNNFNVETPNPRAFAESRATVARAAARFTSRLSRFT